MKRLIVSALGIAILAVGISTALPVQTRPQPASASQQEPFDHSNCQYPDRTTNPPNGCDNSDPCDPAQTKGGSGDCLPTGTAEKQQAIAEHDAPFNPAPPKAAECGGK